MTEQEKIAARLANTEKALFALATVLQDIQPPYVQESMERTKQLEQFVMKNLATKEKPTESGWYLWWSEPEDSAPYHVLALVEVKDADVVVSFNWDTADNWSLMSDVADRLWLKVS